jgi:hypothetical protein
MDTDLPIRSWLVTLEKIRGGNLSPDEFVNEVNELIRDLEKLLENKAPPKRIIVSHGKRVSNLIFHILIRYGEHEAVRQMVEWLKNQIIL